MCLSGDLGDDNYFYSIFFTRRAGSYSSEFITLAVVSSRRTSEYGSEPSATGDRLANLKLVKGPFQHI